MKLLRFVFDAPMMAFPAVSIDSLCPTLPVPTISMIVGLLGNAMGIDHSEPKKLFEIQDCIKDLFSYVEGNPQTLKDFQTVDLTQPHLSEKLAWTTRGKLLERSGGETKTHIRNKEYVTNCIVTSYVEFSNDFLEKAACALKNPRRPLFIGRKCCIPAMPIYGGIAECQTVKEIDMLHKESIKYSFNSDDKRFILHIPCKKDWINNLFTSTILYATKMS